jgi:hypothetical protein
MRSKDPAALSSRAEWPALDICGTACQLYALGQSELLFVGWRRQWEGIVYGGEQPLAVPPDEDAGEA